LRRDEGGGRHKHHEGSKSILDHGLSEASQRWSIKFGAGSSELACRMEAMRATARCAARAPAGNPGLGCPANSISGARSTIALGRTREKRARPLFPGKICCASV
jgi:hypothetical protein